MVDLRKFRRRGYGDQYRILYDSLAKDPNSLSNLDQDLPNYAQHTIPIHSLPREWLWCETWCGNGTKGRAKTIDLCNNPRTKEPKLSAARRIIAEWPALDAEQAAATAEIEAEIEAERLGLAAGAGAAGGLEAGAAAAVRTAVAEAAAPLPAPAALDSGGDDGSGSAKDEL